MAWQQYVADVILEIDPDTGELAYDEYVLTVPRQSGKSTFVLAKAAHRCSATGFFGDRQRIAYTAQTRAKAREKWEEDYAAELERSRKYKTRVTVHKGNGNEHIRFSNGSRFGIDSNTEKAGHGGTLDEGFIDEAFAQVDNRIEQAFGPAMITRRNKQLGVISTAGWVDSSPYLLNKVRVGRELVNADVRRGTAYFDWSAPDDANPGDVAVWLDCMPALHRPDCEPTCKRHTIRLSAIQSEYDKAVRDGKVADFCRAYLNQWKPKPREGEETALGNWAACHLVDWPEDIEPGALGIGVSRDRKWCSIGAGVEIDGQAFVALRERFELVDSAQVIEKVREMVEVDPVPVAMVRKGPGSSLFADLEAEGFQMVGLSFDEYADACSDVTDRIRARTISHPGQSELNEAAMAARWRVVGDRQVLSRKDSKGDISPTEAVLCALRGTEAGSGFNVW